jgi:hypothetical protein
VRQLTFADEYEIDRRLWASGHGMVAVSTWKRGERTSDRLSSVPVDAECRSFWRVLRCLEVSSADGAQAPPASSRPPRQDLPRG